MPMCMTTRWLLVCFLVETLKQCVPLTGMHAAVSCDKRKSIISVCSMRCRIDIHRVRG